MIIMPLFFLSVSAGCDLEKYNPCYAMKHIAVLPGEPEYLGTWCSAIVYLKNESLKNIIVYYHVLDTMNDADYWESIKIGPQEEMQVMDNGGWLVGKDQEGNTLYRIWTEVTATHDDESCDYIGDDILGSGIKIVNVEDLNPCQ